MEISGNLFIVTGGASGLGAACAGRLAEHGAKVIVADLNDVSTSDVSTNDGACANSNSEFIRTDVTDPGSVAALMQSAVDRFGPLRGVINCAGILGASRVVGRKGPHDLDLFSRVIQVNLIGTFNVIRLAAAAMSENSPLADDERGVIVNTSSVAAFEGQIGQAAYSASKGGVASMTLPIARELAQFGIRVVAIAPGVFLTPMMQATSEQVVQSLEQQTLFPKRLGHPAEFAMLVQQVIENPMINGTTLRLDGAVRMGVK